MSVSTATVATSAYNESTGCFEVIDLEQVPAPVDLSGITVSAQDVGCQPGAALRVAVLDENGEEVDAVEIPAT